MRVDDVLRPTKVPSILLILSVLLVVGNACIGFGDLGTLKSTVETGGADAAQASFRLNRGELNVGGGASSLMQAEFITNSRDDPRVDYQVHNQQGALTVTQAAEQTAFSMGPIENSWSVDLNDDIPLAISVVNTDAHLDLNLDTLTMTGITLDTQRGDATVSVDGVQKALTNLVLNSTSGDLHLEMNGNYAQPRTIVASAEGGSINADLSGNSSASVTGSFKTTSGKITVVVPNNIGVEIETSTTTGSIDAGGLTDTGGGMFVNSAFGNSKITMLLSLRTVSGSIKLR